ncbi:MAG: hypothetical protein ACNA7K_04710 [Acholeplasmataceae bacterium]
MQYQVKTLETTKEIKACQSLLELHDLSFEQHVTHTIGIFDGDLLIGTGSLDHDVIKMIAVDPSYQGENLTALIMTHLVLKLSQDNIYKFFLYTKPENQLFFKDFGLSMVAKTEDIILFENNIYTLKERLADIKATLPAASNFGAIVMNCNPVTLGHQYLIETAAKKHPYLLIFLVEEDLSVFPFDIRRKLLEKAISHISNVIIILSTPYIISKTTFPTYFTKSATESSRIHMVLDAMIFKMQFMPSLDISMRYVGTEPTDDTTLKYNESLKKVLGNQLTIIERKMHQSNYISASHVRKLAQQKDFEHLKNIVPKATYQFLKSKKGQRLFL